MSEWYRMPQEGIRILAAGEPSFQIQSHDSHETPGDRAERSGEEPPPCALPGREGRVCLTRIVRGMEDVLASLAGEAELEVSLDPGIGAVRVDPVQIEDALSRMVIAARPGRGGVLHVATESVWIDGTQPGLREGRYARLVVSSRGQDGVDEGTSRTLLSVARGVVSHPGGQIGVESHPDGGRTFRLLLPTDED